MSKSQEFKKSAQGVREIVMDTEATGLLITEGHRLVEVALVEMIDRKLTGREFHVIINPERDIPPVTVAIHHITNEIAATKPPFRDIAADLRSFIGDDPVIITGRTTNGYTLDIDMLNMEFKLAGEAEVPAKQWINVRRWSEAMWGDVAARLDNVLDRYGISRAVRDEKGHGALLDAQLLAAVYPKLEKDYADFLKAGPAVQPVSKDNQPKA